MTPILLESTMVMKNPIVESAKDGFKRLRGIVMQADAANRNGRIYPRAILEAVVNKFNEGGSVNCMGELEHPNSLTINLERVSHVVESLEMVDNDVIGCLKILNTPCGQIVQGLIEGGCDIGASSRGGGAVEQRNQLDEVTDFDFLTLDLVGSPSANQAYPSVVNESIETDPHTAFVESVHSQENQALLRNLLVNGLIDSLKAK